MLRSLDIVLLTAMLGIEPDERETFAQLATHLHSSAASISRSVSRLQEAGLVRRQRSGSLTPADYIIDRHAMHELLTHAIRYFMPTTLGLPHVGVATAHAGPDLSQRIRATEPYVWPTPDGDAYGPTVEPLEDCVPTVARAHPFFYRVMALVDAGRVGRVRERTLAAELLRDLLMKEIPWKPY